MCEYKKLGLQGTNLNTDDIFFYASVTLRNIYLHKIQLKSFAACCKWIPVNHLGVFSLTNRNKTKI